MENAEFYEDEYSTFYIWYYDGVNRYLLGNDYTCLLYTSPSPRD